MCQNVNIISNPTLLSHPTAISEMKNKETLAIWQLSQVFFLNPLYFFTWLMESVRPRSGSELTAAARTAHEKISGAISTICKVYKYGSFSEHYSSSTDCTKNDILSSTESSSLRLGVGTRASVSYSYSSSTPQPHDCIDEEEEEEDSEQDNIGNLPFSRYTPHPHLNYLPNDKINDTNLRFNANVFYINSMEDVSETECSDQEIETPTPGLTPGISRTNSYGHPLGLVLVDASSNWSVPEYQQHISNTSSKSRTAHTTTTGNIQCTVKIEKRSSPQC